MSIKPNNDAEEKVWRALTFAFGTIVLLLAASMARNWGFGTTGLVLGIISRATLVVSAYHTWQARKAHRAAA